MLPLLTHASQIPDGLRDISPLHPGKELLAERGAFGVFLLVLPSRNQNERQILNRIRELEIPVASDVPFLVGVPRNGEAIREFGRELVAYVRRQLFLRIDDNYFSLSTTIT